MSQKKQDFKTPDINQDKLSVQESDTVDKYKQETQKQLDIAKDILKSVKDNPELYAKFVKEYQDVEKNIIVGLKGDKEIERMELNLIKAETFDLIKLAQDNKTVGDEVIASFTKENEIGDNAQANKRRNRRKESMRNWVKSNVDFSQLSDNDISYYVENPEKIYLIDNEDYLLKVLGEYQNEKPPRPINLNNINPSFRNNINFLKKIENLSLDYLSLSILNKDFFKNFNNLIFLLQKSINIKDVFQIMKNIYQKNDLFKIINKLNEHKNEWIGLNPNDQFSEGIGGFGGNIINYIPLNILKEDKKNDIGLKEGYFFSDMEEENINDIKEIITNITSEEIKDNSPEHGNIGHINQYIETNGINEIKKEIKVLIKNGGLKCLTSINNYLNNENIDLVVYALQQNIENRDYIPIFLRGNEKIITTLVESKSLSNDEILKYIELEYIEFNNIHSVINFYKLVGTNSNILLNKKIRYKIGQILETTNISSLLHSEILSPEEKILLRELNKFTSKIFEKGKEITEINKKLRSKKEYEVNVKKIFERYGIKDGDKIYKGLSLEGLDTPDIYGDILIALGTNKDKAPELITEILALKIEKNNTDSKKLKQEYSQKFKKDAGEMSKLEGAFSILYSTKKKENGETTEQFNERIIKEVCETQNISNIEEKEALTEILEKKIKGKKLKHALKDKKKFISYLSGKITKKEYEKQIFNDIRTDLNNDINSQTKSESNESSNNLSTHIVPEEYYSTNSLGGYTIATGDGKTVTITEEEKEITQNNPEALKNLINFHDFFEDLNLESVWKYRGDIVDAMGDINIDLTDNSLNEVELLKFGKKLIRFINNISGVNGNPNKEKLLTPNNIGGVKNELRKYSGAGSMLNDDKTHGIYGLDKFEYDLRNLRIVGNSFGFKKETFNKIMKG